MELVADERPLRECSANDVHRFVTRMTARLWTMPLEDAAALEDVLRSLHYVERWLARMYIVTHSAAEPVFERCPVYLQQRWFARQVIPAATVARALQTALAQRGSSSVQLESSSSSSPPPLPAVQSVVRYSLCTEYVADLTVMIYEMRQHLLLHRTLCFATLPLSVEVEIASSRRTTLRTMEAVAGGDDIRSVAELPSAYDDRRIDVMVRFVCSLRSDARTFLEQAHAFMLQRSVNIGEVERYQRSHRGNAARRPGDLLHHVRGPNPTSYIINKSADLSVASVWDEETSLFARELFVHELLLNDFRSRLANYNWKENVLYAPAIATAGSDASERFIVEQSVRRAQPFIVQSVGSFILVHQCRCYRTTRFGEATALWFWLVNVDRMPPQLQRLTLAYRALLWQNDATLMQNVDKADIQTQPPCEEYIMISS
jgi:hypothetical protein